MKKCFPMYILAVVLSVSGCASGIASNYSDTVNKKVICKCCVSSAVAYQITFENDKENLNKNGNIALQELAHEMSKQKYLFDQYSLMITVHTDSRGNADYNRWLSKKRAETIRNFLSKELDVSSDRFIVRGHGNDELIYTPDDTPQKRARNRRVEFKLIE